MILRYIFSISCSG